MVMVTSTGRDLRSDAFDYYRVKGYAAEMGIVVRRQRNNISTWNFHSAAKF